MLRRGQTPLPESTGRRGSRNFRQLCGKSWDPGAVWRRKAVSHAACFDLILELSGSH